MNRHIKRNIGCMVATIALCAAIFVGNVFVSHATSGQSVSYINSETGYRVIVEDDAGLLTDTERAALAESMEEITAYGNVAFKSIADNNTFTSAYADGYYKSVFGKSSGTVFLIDMDNRNIYIFSDGKIYDMVTPAYAETVTDNVYRYASDEEYFLCASKAFEQITALLKGHRIAQPMKYISNALLALIIGLLLNFGLAIYLSKPWRTEKEELLGVVYKRFTTSRLTASFLTQTKTYSPRSSGGGGHGGGGHGGGGGGRSGGGGGHSF